MPIDSDAGLREVLGLQTVAVVGCSRNPGKDAHDIPKYLVDNGYTVIPVNPNADEVLGRAAYDSLAEVEEPVDMVNVFRPSDEVAAIVDAAIDRDDVKVVWTQQGIVDEAAARRAEEAGLQVVMDRCVKIEHQRLVG